MARNESTKILTFGGTGYISSYMVKASTNLGYPTYVYSRPTSPRIDLLNEFHSSGVTIFKGELDEHEKLVSVFKEVDIVISALACPQVLDQLKIIEAIKVDGNIKRFLPSDFGCEEDRRTVLPSFQEFLNKKKKIRRAIEAEGIPYTFVSANCFGAYSVNYLLHPHDHKKEDLTVYGSGEANEEDIGSYTIRVAYDPTTCNTVVIFRRSTNTLSQLELIKLWEEKMDRKLKKIHVSEKEIVNLSKNKVNKTCLIFFFLVNLYVGVTANFDLKNKDLEASKLYSNLKFTTIRELLHIFKCNPPKLVLAAFE
ncbi:unnamed protein product [Coffea canephora]|uniref:NmrA-like domain-containing protein n=1 Tax=Coffea canephora TaxID=49390 RepID=A0A068V7M4_COFCA|nr:unnamed protein product [Coffea canephora]